MRMLKSPTIKPLSATSTNLVCLRGLYTATSANVKISCLKQSSCLGKKGMELVNV